MAKKCNRACERFANSRGPLEIDSQDLVTSIKRASRLHALLHDVRLAHESIDRTGLA